MKRNMLVMVIFLSLQCSASLIIAPAIFEGVATDFPETLTVDIYNQSNIDVLVEVEMYGLTQRTNGVIKIEPEYQPLLFPEKDQVVVPASSKASLNLHRKDSLGSVYQVAVLKDVTSKETHTVSQAVAVPFMLRAGKEELAGRLKDFSFSKTGNAGLFQTSIENLGKEHFEIEVAINLMDNGSLLQSEKSHGVVLPGATRTFTREVSSIPDMLEGQLVLEIGNKRQIYDFNLESDTGKLSFEVAK